MNNYIRTSGSALPMRPQLLMPTGNLTSNPRRSILTTNGTSQLISARPNFQPPFFLGGAQMPNATIAPLPNLPLVNNAAYMKYYAKKKALELEEQKMLNQTLFAQVQQFMARDEAREKEVQTWTQLLSALAQPETVVEADAQDDGGASGIGVPLLAPQPDQNSSTLVSSQLAASISLAVPPPPQVVPAAFQSALFTANSQEAYHINQSSDRVQALPNEAQGFGIMPPPPLSAAPSEVQQYQQQFNFVPPVHQDQQLDFMLQVQPYPQTNGLYQLSNRRPQEHRLGTLQQQQVEQVQLQGNLPPKPNNLTNGVHYHQGNGATAFSSDSSKRKRDESGDQGNRQKEAGGGPSPPKRRRENKSGGKDKEREVATTTGNESFPSTSSKRKRDEAGDADASNEAGGDRGAEPKASKKQRTEPYTHSEALKVLLSGRYCEWDDECDHELEPRLGAYEQHIRQAHGLNLCPKTGNLTCLVNNCRRVFPKGDGFRSHLDHLVHRNDTRMKCLNCDKELGESEVKNRRVHYRGHRECEKEVERFDVVKGPPLRLKAGILSQPAGRSQRAQEVHIASVKKTQDILRMQEEMRQEKMRRRAMKKDVIDGQV
ncbi:hypothetical protein H1R20_g6327, partial [Candolleomyces eurysporus]